MTQIHYSEALERLLKREAEKALALRWAHSEAQRHCSTYDRYLQIPSIILSFLSGTGAVGSDTLLPFSGGMMVVGFISVFVGILGSVQSYLDFSKRAEGHRIAALNFEKLHRTISIELALPRSERESPEKLIDRVKKEVDSLSETSPLMPTAIKEKFKQQFHDLEGIALPESLNGLSAVDIAPEPDAPKEVAQRPIVRITL